MSLMVPGYVKSVCGGTCVENSATENHRGFNVSDQDNFELSVIEAQAKLGSLLPDRVQLDSESITHACR